MNTGADHVASVPVRPGSFKDYAKGKVVRIARETTRRPGEVEEGGSTRVSYCEREAWKKGV